MGNITINIELKESLTFYYNLDKNNILEKIETE
jgi:hypothetical protein